MPDPSAPDFSRVVHLFVELRGKGLSLSAADLECLRGWSLQRIPSAALVEFLLGVSEECALEERGFPLTLKALDTRLRRALRDGRLRFDTGEESPLDDARNP